MEWVALWFIVLLHVLVYNSDTAAEILGSIAGVIFLILAALFWVAVAATAVAPIVFLVRYFK